LQCGHKILEFLCFEFNRDCQTVLLSASLNYAGVVS
jgi:hypothetical protein